MMPDRNAEYQATYRRRAAFNAQATLLGWTKLELLSAYLTGDGELVVIDKSGARYGTEATALAPPDQIIVTPADVPVGELGSRWEKARPRISGWLADGALLDLTAGSRAETLTALETLAASALRAVEVLRDQTGPDWRESIGLETAS